MKKLLVGILLCAAAYAFCPVAASAAENFAVIWHWQTQDESLVRDNLVAQFEQLKGLLNDGVVESVYYDPEPEAGRLGNYPGISFCIQATSVENARERLDDMVFVRENISAYRLFPVGAKWLGKNDRAMDARGIQRSYVTVWTTVVDPTSEAHEELVAEQTQALVNLWNRGVVENAYFDAKGLKQANDVADFVFYVNAASEAEAREVVHGLPFYREGIARYNLYPVGMSWLSKTDDD